MEDQTNKEDQQITKKLIYHFDEGELDTNINQLPLNIINITDIL